MIAADTSTWINFLKNSEDKNVLYLQSAFERGAVVMPPPVLMELLSFPGVKAPDQKLFTLVPQLEIIEDFWERAGEMRRAILKKGLKARSMDCLIAQSCIDHGVELLESDQNFRHFVKFGLKILS